MESLDKDNELMCERTGRCSATLTREVGIRAWKLNDYDNHPCMPHICSTNGGQMYAVEERLCPISMQRNPLRVTLLNMWNIVLFKTFYMSREYIVDVE
jgi:hypothetical protein